MAPPLNSSQRELTPDDLVSAGDAEREMDEEDLLLEAQEVEDSSQAPLASTAGPRLGTRENPMPAKANPVYEPMAPEDIARLNPPWTPPKQSPYAEITSDPALQKELEEASATGLTSSIRGYSDFLTRGFNDEILGYVGSRFPRLAMPMSEAFNPDIPTPPSRSYEEVRDEMRKASAQAREQEPGYYYTGAALSALTPGPKLGGGPMGALRTGMLEGGVGALGASEANLVNPTGGDLVQAGAETGLGAGIGGTLGAGLYGMGAGAGFLAQKYGPKFRQWLATRFAPTQAMRAMGGTGADFTYMTTNEGAQKVLDYGRTILDEDVLEPFASKEKLFQNVTPARAEAGLDMGAALKAADDSGTKFNLGSMLDRVENEIIKPGMTSPALQQQMEALQGMVNRFRATYPEGVTDFANANKIKSDLGNTMNWGEYWNRNSPQKFLDKFQKQLIGVFNDEIEGQLEKLTSPETRAAFEAAKDRYAALQWAQQVSGRGIGKEIGNAPISMKDMQAAEVASNAAQGIGPMVGAAAALGFKFARQRGASATALGADRAAKSNWLKTIIQTDPEVLGQFGSKLSDAYMRGGEAGLALQDYILGMSDPEYAEQRRKLLSERAAVE